MKKFYLKNLSKSRLLASRLAVLLRTGDILALEGKLGAGMQKATIEGWQQNA